MSPTTPKVFQFASTNAGKLAEVRTIAQRFGVTVFSPTEVARGEARQFGFTAPIAGAPPEVEENENSYAAHAQKKAQMLYRWSALPTLGDDTGIEVAALNGGPGLHSARYAGPNATALQNREKLLQALADCGDRSARFVCHLHLQLDGMAALTSFGVITGVISASVSGAGGFGYDSIFFLPSSGKTLAQAKEHGDAVKTHREIALETLLKEWLKR